MKPDNKAKINTDYYMIKLDSEWTSYIYKIKHNVMDQDDRYNFATKNWSYDLDDLEYRAYDILHILTCKEDEEIAKIMFNSEPMKGLENECKEKNN